MVGLVDPVGPVGLVDLVDPIGPVGLVWAVSALEEYLSAATGSLGQVARCHFLFRMNMLFPFTG